MSDLWPEPTKLADKMRAIAHRPSRALPRCESVPQLYALGTTIGKLEAHEYFVAKILPKIMSCANERACSLQHILKWFWSDEPTARLGNLLRDILVNEGFIVRITTCEEPIPDGYDGSRGLLVHWKYEIITISW